MVENDRSPSVTESQPVSRPWTLQTTVENVIIVAAFFVCIVLLQIGSGAYKSELAHHPDEPAHVVTSLMFGDYMRHGFPENPWPYAQKYYVHYPKVAVGMWPPGFYFLSGAWTVAFGASRASLLAFAALLGALLSASLTVFVRRSYGRALGLTAGAALALLHRMQLSNERVMLDTAVSLACFWSMWLLVEYFRKERLKTALAFGAVTAAAMLVKGNANACVLMVPFLLLLMWRFDLLKRAGLYVAGALILALGLPWQVASFKMLHGSVPMAHVDGRYVRTMADGYTRILAADFTPVVGAFILVGLACAVWPRLRKLTPDPLALAGSASLLLAVLIFHCLAPNPGPDERYMTAALAPGLVLFVAGCRMISRLRIPVLPSASARAAVLVGVSLASAWAFGAYRTSALRPFGFMAATDIAMAQNAPRNAMLVCSDSEGEGAFVAEVALRDRALSRIVLRASKVISQSPWTGGQVKMLQNTRTELENYLHEVAVDVVVLDRSVLRIVPAGLLLNDYLEAKPAEWRRANVPGAHIRDIVVYTRADRSRLVPGRIRISLPHTLGRDVELESR